mmetsp:Transcript_56127/g.93542  ORF Transcript_56127/g.93542 Transcript_56127/m.93542 type:complete len:146 (-) Transcript_56127:263-700(-)|eukprot:CAMPEP_0202713800 /NCGR_PEP_ID=MMETSP1385-20130828/59659_1 /ASSEMBLY_ACC=CAM_ASM_000861 /TAXON_ID=933848 /ORGANISM="Elphidium margaritaceum" /LENGTH=145 /DNA_ID=CAMNT_0049374287 /DNA_START=25 /DNA_END=462 /DNA_ORIENTATION=+
MEVSSSCRGHPSYKNYKPYEIEVKKRIAKWGYMRARIGRPQLASFLMPLLIFQVGTSWWSQAMHRRNRKHKMDEEREMFNRLFPLYKHEECKYRYLEEEEIRFNAHRAAMELGSNFDFDELKIYHYPERHPDANMAAQAGIIGQK